MFERLIAWFRRRPEKFTCVICGGTFAKAWTDEEAKAEYEALYGHRGKGWERSASFACGTCWKASGMDTGDEAKWKGPVVAAVMAKARGERP